MNKINKEEYGALKGLDDKWKWIARDDDTSLWVYEEKPIKIDGESWYDIDFHSNLDDSLFQFIQWKDNEPYNIAELIEEYESEETEVKNIEWLKGRFWGRKLLHPQNDRDIGYNMAIDEFSEYVDQFEMETVEITEEQVMEWLDNNDFYDHATAETVLANAVDKGELGYYGTKYSVVEKPTIPKFVADWIEFKKKSRIPYENVLQAIDELVNSSTSKAHDWVLKTSENKDAFARAWLDGFTVEEEQKYYVLDSEDIPLLEKANNQTCKTTTGLSIYEDGRDNSRFELTEQEIKDYDPRYWAFAVKVEEME